MKDVLPLKGQRIVLTRPEEENARLGERLEALGASVLSLPLISVRESMNPKQATEILKEFASYEWLVFTSRNGVRHFMEVFLRAFSDIRALGFVRIAVLGQGTAEALKSYFLKADLVAPEATASSLSEALNAEQCLDNVKVLVVTGNRNKPDLVNKLWEARAIVDQMEVYATELRDLSEDASAEKFRREGADALVFASASAVQAFGEQAKHLALEKGATVPALCSFGPATSARMKAATIPISVESEAPGLDGMVDALVAHFSEKKV